MECFGHASLYGFSQNEDLSTQKRQVDDAQIEIFQRSTSYPTAIQTQDKDWLFLKFDRCRINLCWASEWIWWNGKWRCRNGWCEGNRWFCEMVGSAQRRKYGWRQDCDNREGKGSHVTSIRMWHSLWAQSMKDDCGYCRVWGILVRLYSNIKLSL